MARKLAGAEERKAKLRQKIQNEIDNAGKQSKYKSIVDLGENVTWYKPVNTNEETSYQTNKIDVIPFIITTENHPDVRKKGGDSKVGDPCFDLDISYHRNMGVNQDTPVLCLAKTYKEKCPICEELSRLYAASVRDEKRINELKPKRRVFYNVIDKTVDNGETQVWNSSFYLFKEGLNNKMTILKAQGKGQLVPACWDEGLIICFNGKHRPGGEGYKDFTLCEDFVFEERDYSYPDPASGEGKENAYDLDAFITPPTYEEAWEIFYGEEMGSSEDKEIPDHISVRKSHNIDEEESPKQETNSDNPCPGGYVFGKDNQNKDLCAGGEQGGIECGETTFEDCVKEKERLEKAESKPTRGSR